MTLLQGPLRLGLLHDCIRICFRVSICLPLPCAGEWWDMLWQAFPVLLFVAVWAFAWYITGVWDKMDASAEATGEAAKGPKDS
jgi:hypothetical protein